MSTESISSAPASFSQQSIWLSHGIASTPSAFNLLWSLTFTGTLDTAELCGALSNIIHRHDALRSVFNWTPSGLLQRTLPSWMINLCVEQQSEPTSSDDLDALEKAYGDVPYDLEQGPLFRFKLLRLCDVKYVLLCGFHHLIIDGTSWKIFVNELMHFLGNKTPLRPSAQSVAFAQWQQRQMDSQQWNSALHHWRMISHANPAYEFPREGIRTIRSEQAGLQYAFNLPDILTDRLKTTSQALNLSPFRIAFAAFFAFLSALSKQDHLLVATTLVGRTDPAFNDSIGLFVNTGLIGLQMGSQDGLTRLVAEIDRQLNDVVKYEDYPYDLAIRNLAVSREPGRDPFTPVSFTKLPTATIRHVAGMKVSEKRVFLDVADRDLSVYMQKDEGAFRFTWVYKAGSFATSTIGRYAQQFQRMLSQMLETPDLPVRDIDIVLASERQTLLQDWNQTTRHYPQAKCLHHMVEEQSSRTPDRIAIRSSNQDFTYRQVNDLATRLAFFLRSRGIGPGCFVPLMMASSPELLIAELAVMKTGAAFSPIDPDWPINRIHSLLQQLGSTVVVLATRENAVQIDPAYDIVSVAVILAETNEVSTATDTAIPCSLDSPLYCMFTSGSTGTPKGAVNQHLGIVNRLCVMNDWFGSADDNVILATSPGTGDSVIWQYFWPLIVGGRCIIAPREDVIVPEKIVGLLREQRVTFMDFIPSIFQLLVKYLSTHPEALSAFNSVKRILIGGDILPVEAVKKFRVLLPHVLLMNTYGPTETSIGVIFHEIDREIGYPTPIGRPLPNVKAVILDEGLQLMPLGSVGELCLGGLCVGLGYLNDPDMTRKTFVKNPFPELKCSTLYRTGDRARFRPDGVIEFLGRMDYQLKIRSLRMEPGEIEAAISRHPQIAEALVVLTHTHDDEKQLLAYVCAHDAKVHLKQHDLRDFLLQDLPRHMIPSIFIQVSSLSLTPGGKINRDATQMLPGRLLNDKKKNEKPRCALETLIVSLWHAILNQDNISVHDHFFSDLGGDSLSAILFMTRFNDSTPMNMTLRDLYEYSTPAALAYHLVTTCDVNRTSETKPQAIDVILQQQRPFVSTWSGVQAYSDSFLFTLNALGTNAPLFWCFQGYEELHQLAHHLGPSQPVTGMRSGHLIMAYSDTNVDALASHYACEMMHLQPSGAFCVGGNCQGAIIAQAIAQALMRAGRSVGLLILMEDNQARTYDGQVALLFGCESQFNPFKEGATPDVLFRKYYPKGYTVDLIPGAHGQFFNDHHVVHLADAIKKRLQYFFEHLNKQLCDRG
ncbi:MAG TPA: hypothetical protein DDY37_03675 [Legionella sp.]|nr:hypothetical protein [Legionella sp.]